MITASYLCVPLQIDRLVTEQEWQESIPLDAPRDICSGSHEQYEFMDKSGIYPMPTSNRVR